MPSFAPAQALYLTHPARPGSYALIGTSCRSTVLDPRFRSAPTDDKHRSDASNFLTSSLSLVPRQAATGSPPLCVRSCLSFTARFPTRVALDSDLVSENMGQVSNEATVASVTALQFALQSPQDRLQPSRVTVAAVALPAATKARPPQGVAARLEHSWVSCSTQLRVAAPAFLAARL